LVAIAPYMLLPMIFARFADAARDGVMRVPGSPIVASGRSVRMTIHCELVPLFGR
jgi:hypothetical protein